MARAEGRVDLSRVVIEVKLPRAFYVRMWAARKLILLAALVLGCGIRVSEE